MNIFGIRRPKARPASRGSSFFVDSIGDPTLQLSGRRNRRTSDMVIFAIALATAIGVAGLFGLLQLWRA